eukprot:COSAG06_NODE_3185_length_5718_cov_5.232960_4_plen_84_part_00
MSSQANAAGAKISTADLYSYVLGKCGGSGYAHCDGSYFILWGCFPITYLPTANCILIDRFFAFEPGLVAPFPVTYLLYLVLVR